MVFVIGLIFQVTSPYASMFIAVQHNTTLNMNTTHPPPAPYFFDEQLYTVGWKDGCCVFFYTLIAVVIHALVQGMYKSIGTINFYTKSPMID